MNHTAQENQRIARRNRRILIAGIGFTLCYLVIGLKAVYLQVFADDGLSQRASSEYCRAVESRGKRGTIYDVKSRELVVSTKVVNIGAHPRQIENPGEIAAAVSQVLTVDRQALEKRLALDKSFVWIKRNESPDKAKALSRVVSKGLDFTDSFSRIYPNKSLSAQVLGFSGTDAHGLEGLEYYYDEYLKGDTWKQTVIKDALGRIFQQTKVRTPEMEGKNLILTIDANIQFIAEQALKKAVLKYNAKSGMAVVMRPDTGAIRALAHYPTFNPNAFGQFPRETWRNRAITDPFEPGSTMKVFLAAAALDSGICTPGTQIDCENGKYRIGSNVIHDTHPYEWLTLHDIVKYSSNIGAAKIAEMIGPKALYDTLGKFGFGEKTGIDCPGESAGTLRHYESWRAIDHATISFGQGVSVSAVQLLTAVSAIANHGVLMQPRMVKAITNPDGSILQQFEPKIIRQAINPETAEQLKIMMRAVTEPDGTGPQAVPDGYPVCGKTGTAQIINSNGTYLNCEYNAAFVGFAPFESPKLAVLVMVEGPKGNHYGGIVAAPAFREIVRETFNYLDVPPVLPGPTVRLKEVNNPV